MPRVSPLLPSFNAGELSPRLAARVDFGKYPAGCEVLENLIPLIEGGVMRRPGSRFVAAVKTSANPTVLIPFTFSTTQAYVIEVGGLYFRFYRNQGQITSGSPVEVTTVYTEAQLFDADNRLQLGYTQSADVLFLTQENHEPSKLSRTSDTAWTLTEFDFGTMDGPYLDENTTSTTMTPAATSGSGIVVTASAVTGINDGDGFKTTDVGRLIRIDNPSSGANWGFAEIVTFTSTTVVRVDIKRNFGTTSADTNWRLGAWSDTTGFPRVVTFFEQRLVFAGNTNQPQTIWFSQTGDFENFAPDSPTSADVWDGTVEDDDAMTYTVSADEVNAIRWLAGTTSLLIGTGGGEWIARSEGPILTPTDVDIKRHTKRGSSIVPPVVIDESVLFLHRANRRILSLGFSFEADGFKALDQTELAYHLTFGGIIAMAYQQEPDSLVWCPRKDGQLTCFTNRAIQNVEAWSRHILGGSFGAGNAVVESATTIAGNDGSGQTFDSTARDEVWLVVKRTVNGSTVRQIEFLERSFEGGHAQRDAFYVDSGLTLNVWNTTTSQTLTLAAATADEWDDGDTGTMTAVSHTPFLSGDVGDIWELALEADIVQAKITAFTSSTVVTVEFLQDVPTSLRSAAISDWLDPGSKTTSVTGLAHLEGEIVKVFADGATHPDRTVTSGVVTLQSPAGKAQIGLGYTHKLKTLKMEAGAAAGTAMGKVKRIHGITIVVLDSMVAKIGPESTSLEEFDFREVSDPMDVAAPLFTGERFIEFDDDYDRDTRIVIEGDAPAPFTLLALAPEMKTNEQI